MIHERIQRSFRRGLHSYHQASVAQAEIAAQLTTRLAELAPERFEKVLEFGCGTGHLTRALTKGFAIGHLYLNDLVPDCAELAGRHHASFLSGPIEATELPTELSLISSASTIQWIEDTPALIQRLWQHLEPGGWLAMSGFTPGHFCELHSLGSTAAAPSYMNLDNWASALPSRARIHCLSEYKTVLYFDTPREVLRHLRDTGVNGNARTLWTRKELARFEKEYSARFEIKDRVPLTYAASLIIAQKTTG